MQMTEVCYKYSSDNQATDTQSWQVQNSTYPPNIDTSVLAQTFVVKAINLSNLSAFVVATDERDPIRVTYLEGEKKEEGLHGVVAPIDKVAEEEVVLVGTFASDLEQLH